jgi:cytoskeleton protein RodZ
VLEIGSSLREARRRRQLELADVEAATRIRTQQLEALERERFELLPPDPYRRSFLREYADFLGLDGDLYVHEYDLRFRPPEPTPPTPPSRRRLELGRLLGPRPLFLVGSVVAVAAIFGVSVWLLGGSGGTGTATSIAATHARTRPSPHTHRHAAPERAPGLAARALVLTGARGSCWLWVRIGSAGGPTVYEQTLQAGQTVRFGLRRPLWIRLGAPWNIEAAIGRRSLSRLLPVETGDVLVTTAGLRAAA